MDWDYDKLFAEGNIVGIKNKKLNYTFVHKIYSEHIKNILESEEVSLVNWDAFKNDTLEIPNEFEISWIVQLDENGSFLHKIFDRNNDMFPELKDGMMIWVKTEYDDKPNIGIVIENTVIYQNGGFDDIDGPDGIRNDIISVYNHKHGFGFSLAKPIWGQNMNAYLDID